MISSSAQISSTSVISGAEQRSPNTQSSTAEIISSFKEIMAVMMATSSMPSTTGQIGPGVGELMAPLMLLLLEKLVEGQIEQESTASTAGQASSGVTANASSSATSQGSRPEPSGQPVTGRLTQNYHSGHNGLDIAVPLGTPIQTTMDGRVVHAGWNNQGYGNLVIVENGAYRTYYAHLSSIPVGVGDLVTAGTTIGLSGSTGNSTGPHLHYEIRKNQTPIDPSSATFGAGS